jgi:hypothetical protein
LTHLQLITDIATLMMLTESESLKLKGMMKSLQPSMKG